MELKLQKDEHFELTPLSTSISMKHLPALLFFSLQS